jgi:hypothetical protein
VLWTSLGQQPNLLAELAQWGRALGISDISSAHTLEEASTRLTATLRDRRMLLIVDDVWQVEQAMAFNVGGRRCGTLYTTRQNDIARTLANRPEAIYKIPILEEAQAIELLTTLAPEVVTAHPSEARALVRDLEGLPLALQVAGRLLHAEMVMGWGVGDLLEALRQGARLLEAQAPADRLELATQTTPTIAALLQRSIDRLPVSLQERFAMLAVFAPKPATFTLEAMRAVWLVDDARPDAKVLVDRGLLEPAGNGIFQMHALLVMQAKSMFAV